ncbi:MAG: TetR/AcrR family transcriptional regulator, partial [Opitutales bacterium]
MASVNASMGKAAPSKGNSAKRNTAKPDPAKRNPAKRNPAKRNPEAARQRILAAALAGFSEKGLSGARVDVFSERAGANKRMLYHYFGNKDDLFLVVLELAYGDLREAEKALNLDDLSPVEGMRKLVAFTFDYFNQTHYFINLLNSKNVHGARHLRRQGLLQGTWCLNPDEAMSPGQAEEL